MTQYTDLSVKRCQDVSTCWLIMISSKENEWTVGEMLKYRKMHRDEMTHLFHQMSWEDQILVAVGTHDYVWVELLDSDQLAAYRVMKN